MAKRWTARQVRALKGKERIPVVTCYDWAFARLCDEAGFPILLVGDSLGNTVLGYETTIPVRLEDMIHHAAAVMRARPKAMVVVDMPFLTFQVNPGQALQAAGRILQETGADAVKLEGGRRSVDAVQKITEAGIPVMGHLGLTPQSVHQLGGYRVQGRAPEDAARVRAQARRLQQLGAFAVVLECVPAGLAAEITDELAIPTIGIGAGGGTSGQVLVSTDLLGLDAGFRPRFARRYLDGHAEVLAALNEFARDVRAARFPAREEILA